MWIKKHHFLQMSHSFRLCLRFLMELIILLSKLNLLLINHIKTSKS